MSFERFGVVELLRGREALGMARAVVEAGESSAGAASSLADAIGALHGGKTLYSRFARADAEQAVRMLGQAPDHCVIGMIDTAIASTQQALDALPAVRQLSADDLRALHMPAAGMQAAPSPPGFLDRVHNGPRANAVEAALDEERAIVRHGLEPAAAAEVDRWVRTELVDAFEPLVDELAARTRQLRDQPLDAIPLHGGSRSYFDRLSTPQRYVDDADPGMIGDLDPADLASAPGRFTTPLHHLDGSAFTADLMIGEYGEPLARALDNAMRAMSHIAVSNLHSATRITSYQHADVLARWTFQQDASRALVEGIASQAQALALLTSKKVDGLDALQLLDELRDGRLVNRIARGPLGLVAPFNGEGMGPAVALQREGGRLRLSDTFQRILGSLRAARTEHGAFTPQTGTGCPLSWPSGSSDGVLADSAVMRLNREFVDLTKRYLEAELRAAV